MVDYSYEDLSDALDAIVRGNPTDEAYEIASRFGYYELFYGTIYRKENWMNISTAREILTRAKKDEIIDYEVPEKDDEVLTKAGEVVELAEQAWASNVRGPEVEAILKLAAADANGDAPEKSESEEKKTEEPKSEEAEAPESVPSVFANLPAKLAKDEPWTGYNDASVKEVSEGIVWFAEDENSEQKDEILDILKGVWAYESAHKNRTRVLDFVKEAFTQYGGELGEVVTEGSEGTEGAEEAPESDSSGDSEPGDGADVSADEELPAEESESSGESDSNAEADSSSEASTPSSEGSSGEEKSTPKDSGKGSGGSQGAPSAEAKLVKLVENELARERVDGIPKPPHEKAPELPWNWNDVTDIQLHDLHMQYASLAYYKSYQRARDERIALHCKEAADEIRNKLLTDVPKYDDKNKEIKVTVLDAQIASDPNVRRWRKVQAKYERFAMQAKHELESLHKIVEALSRLMTVRHEMWERARR